MLPLSFSGRQWIPRRAYGEQPLPWGSEGMAERLTALRGLTLKGKDFQVVSPYLIPDMATAAKRIVHAIDQRQSVAIFGDYDCDGVTATAQMVRYFQRNDIAPLVRLPHRVHDGYGLSEHVIDDFIAQDINLLITVDTGASSAREIAKAADAGIDVIVVDHHRLIERPEKALAVVHPALGRDFPSPHPSAAGLVYLLLRALEGETWAEHDTDLALATLGTVADLVELRGANRSLVQRGLLAMSRLPPGPLAHLVEHLCTTGTVSSGDIAFRLAPRINAAGRMAEPDIALRALLHGGADLHALETLNTQRQQETATIMDTLLREGGIDASSPPPLIAAASAQYPHGLLGLLAGTLTETYGRPSMVAVFRNGKGSASLRSTHAYHVAEGLERCGKLFTSFGGHAQAGGCTFAQDAWDEVRAAMTEDVRTHTDPHDLAPRLEIDGFLAVSEVTLDLCEALQALEPFGQGNPEPRFLIRNVCCDGLRRIGGEGKHLQGRIAGRKMVGFSKGDFIDMIDSPVDVVCTIGVDTWNGNRAPQLFLADARASGTEETLSAPQMHHWRKAGS